MANKSKEQQQRELEEKRKLREKQIAQLRASNEMLEDAKVTIKKHYGEDSDTTRDLLKDIDIAKDQNIEWAESYLGSSEYEMNNIKYNEVNPKEVENYNKRLEKRGLTDEQIRKKDITKEMEDAPVQVEKPKSKLEQLKDKLNGLKSNKGGTMAEAVVTEKPMSDEEFNSLLQNRNQSDDNEQFVFDTNKKSETHENEDNTTKVMSIEDIDPKLAYNYKQSQKEVEGFDCRDIPSYIQYDIIPLPSKGECYANKMKAIPVRYLTASDENLITSPNLYNNGSLLDIILERTILDKRVKVGDLCAGDRDAIIIWLRATAYGADYPVVVNNGNIEFKSTVDLSKLPYREFNLVGDENGYFDYKTDSGDELKFKIVSHKEDVEMFNTIKRMFNETNSDDIRNYADKMLDCLRSIIIDDMSEITTITDMVNGIKEWSENIVKDSKLTEDKVYNTTVTRRMIQYTVSVNGNSDPEYIKNYIENMRALDARKYREYVTSNVPGVDLKIKLKIPESQGGGSYETFLSLGETIFLY